MKDAFKTLLIPYSEMESILPLVFSLNNAQVDYDILAERLKTMLSMGSYECIGVYDDDELIGICGFWILNKLYCGKHVEPDNVIVKNEYRNKGIGQLMMDFLFEYAQDIGCVGSEVNCYVSNAEGKKFWERQGYEPLAYHFFKKFD